MLSLPKQTWGLVDEEEQCSDALAVKDRLGNYKIVWVGKTLLELSVVMERVPVCLVQAGHGVSSLVFMGYQSTGI